MKTLSVFLILFTLIFISLPCQHKGLTNKSGWEGTMEQKISGLMTVWAEVKYAFPQKQKLNDLNWDEKVLEFIPKVIGTENIEGYYKVLEEMTALLKDSHTEIIPPWGRFKPGYDNPPLEVKIIGDRFYIIRTGDTDEIRSQEISPGVEILSMGEGIPIRKFFNESILKYHSGNTRHGDDSLYVYFLLYGPENENVKLRIRDLKGKTRDIVLSRKSINHDGSPFFYRFIQNFITESIKSKHLENGILYVKIPNFERDSIHKDFQELIDSINLAHVNGLIIDLRLNMGGSSKSCNNIVQCLIEKPVRSPSMKYPHYIPAEKAWGRKEKWTTISSKIEPRKGKLYTGPIVILTDGITISTAEDMIIELQQRSDVITIGETTSGGAGNGLFSSLPGGGKFRVSTFHATYPDGKEYVSIGIKPDIQVIPSLKDLCEKNDVVLNKAISVLKKCKKN